MNSKPEDNPESQDASIDFLERDFNQCFEQMRHYDGQIWDLFKFTFASYTTVIGAAVAFYQYSLEKNIDLVPVSLALVAVGFLFGLCMLGLVVRNRVYYVYVARYVNEHRGFFLKMKPLGFTNASKMYVNSRKPQFFNWRSSQSFFIYLIAGLNAFLAAILALFVFGDCRSFGATFLVTVIIQLAISISYLATREKKSADKGVFGKS